jgi:hypothetical protein
MAHFTKLGPRVNYCDQYLSEINLYRCVIKETQKENYVVNNTRAYNACIIRRPPSTQVQLVHSTNESESRCV